MMSDEDKQDEEIQRSIDCMFEDFDVDCDGKLVCKQKQFRSMLFANPCLKKLSLLTNTNYLP